MNNYTQIVCTLKSNFGEKRTMVLLYRLETTSIGLMPARKSQHCPRNTKGNGCKNNSNLKNSFI
ncbi:MAG: hypothetical protein ACLU95_08325 [Bacteroides stercoris]|uniref:plasmid mobilization protein n=1 Tax=Bacteroides stercoris TaxID=46506 RepID=UPI0037420C36